MVTFAYPEPQEGVAETYTVIPEGDYDVEIVAVDEKQASAGYQMLSVQFKTEQHGSVFDNLLVGFEHANSEKKETVRRMAFEKLEKIAKACGRSRFAESDEMLAHKLRIKVGHRPDATDPNKIWPDIKSYSPISNVAAAPPVAAPAVAPSSTAAAAPVAQANPWTT
tara:strand:+ start:262 stop:759 length:498 start_codon:yes stop_codon:yes gene_type:complete